MESSSRIPFSTRAKNITVNSIRGLNFDDISTDTLIKKIDANNAGNSNIKNSFTATGSVTQLLNGDPNGIITNIGGEIITSLIGGDAKMELTVGEAGGKRSIILQENQPIVIEDDLSVVILDVGGLIKLDGSSGTAGALLTSNGSSLPTWNPAPTPYYIELDIGDSGGGTIFVGLFGVVTTLNTLTTITTPISNYNSDLIDTSTWSPSVAGLYSINYQATIRCVNQDYLVESSIYLQKEIGGVYTPIKLNNVRNWGSSVNEADARVFTMCLPQTTTVYANIGDKFRFAFYGKSYFSQDIWLLTNRQVSNISITKLL